MKFFKRFENFYQNESEEPAFIFKPMFNFRRIWWINFMLTSAFAIIPLLFFAFIDYNISRKSVETEGILGLSRFTSNAWRSVSFYLDKHMAVLDFAAQDNTYEELKNTERLAILLKNMKAELDEFTDLGVINSNGYQEIYEGPYNLKGKNYNEQEWFNAAVNRGTYVSDVFLGYRNVPHFAIALKQKMPNGDYYVLRATIENQFTNILSKLELNEEDDIFLINKKGIIQTPSRFYGNILSNTTLPVPKYSDHSSVIEVGNKNKDSLLIGYRYIPHTPFILMAVKQKKMLMSPWHNPRLDLIEYLTISIFIVLIWIIIVTSYMVNKLKTTDQRRIRNLHIAESADKMASIGRLSAGVAHELNNPLAVINENAGLIQDMIEFKDQYKNDGKLIKTVDSILYSVDRCKRITTRLLGFARQMDVKIQNINLENLIKDVLGFLEKEAEYRSIEIIVDIPESIPDFQSDQGKLQQIFLNIINNAFAALQEKGKLVIRAHLKNMANVIVKISDNGCGIKPDDLKSIFDPFFSTKTQSGGTGLGLSITCGLIDELGGTIDVKSKVGKGTSFIITLPLDEPPKTDSDD